MSGYVIKCDDVNNDLSIFWQVARKKLMNLILKISAQIFENSNKYVLFRLAITPP